MAEKDLIRKVFSGDAHRQLRRQIRIDRYAQQVVDRSQPGFFFLVKEREIFAVGVGVADQVVEDDDIQERQPDQESSKSSRTGCFCLKIPDSAK